MCNSTFSATSGIKKLSVILNSTSKVIHYRNGSIMFDVFIMVKAQCGSLFLGNANKEPLRKKKKGGDFLPAYVTVRVWHLIIDIACIKNEKGLRLLPQMTRYPAITNNLSHMFKNFSGISEMKRRKGLAGRSFSCAAAVMRVKSKQFQCSILRKWFFISWAGLKGNCIQAVLRFKPVMNSLIRISLLWTMQLLTPR